MKKFLAQRFVFAIMSLVAATLIVFVLSRMAGDPLLLYAKPGGYGMSEEQIAALSEKLALDRPLIVQYFIWLGRVVTGDFGVTLLAERDVRTVVFEKLGATIQLGIAAFVLATLIGIPLGVVSAIALRNGLGLLRSHLRFVRTGNPLLLHGHRRHPDLRRNPRLAPARWSSRRRIFLASPSQSARSTHSDPRFVARRWLSAPHAFIDAGGPRLRVRQTRTRQGRQCQYRNLETRIQKTP